MADIGKDLEKNVSANKYNPAPAYRGSINNSSEFSTEDTAIQGSMFYRVVDSFKRAPDTLDEDGKFNTEHGRAFNPDHAAMATSNTHMARKLKGRHMQMIAIGGSIGECLHQREVYLLIVFRNWTLHRIRQSSRDWRPSVAPDKLFTYRHYVVLYGTILGRDGCALASRWFILDLLKSFLGSQLGLRDGLELCNAMAVRTTTRSHRGFDYGQLLGPRYKIQSLDLRRDIPFRHHYH